MKTLLAICAALTLTGCMSLGVQKMTPEQLKGMENMLTCDNIFSIYARGNSAMVNTDAVKKGVTNDSEITVSPDCSITIKTKSGVPPGTVTTTVVPATTTTTVQPAAKP